MKTEIFTFTKDGEKNAQGLARAAEILRQGGLVAFPTETVYGLGGNGLNPEASARIYQAKGRPSDNPLILHIADREGLLPLVKEIPETAEKLMEAFWPGPMTLIFRKSDLVPRATTGGLDTVAVRMPSHPIAAAMIRAAGVPVAAPSANRSGRPSTTTAAHVIEDLDGRIDMILDGGSVEIGLESTIIDVTGPVPMLLRPGYISREQVAEVTGDCLIDPAILSKPSADLKPKAPGMKYRHYAPRADLTIVEGSAPAVADWIGQRAVENPGRRIGILCAEESAPLYARMAEESGGLGFTVKTVGTRENEESIAHNLFRCLREFDDEDAELIFSEAYRGGPLEAAIMNRLVKAAGYHVVKLEEK